MGIVKSGIPQEIAIELAKLNNCSVFIETGTFHGKTTRWASNYFQKVHTIEKAESLFILHKDNLSRIKNVKPYLGDSKDILTKIVSSLGSDRALYWLDGHWSGGETAGEDNECPLLEEIASISNRAEDIILIDDARLFLCAPPEPHDPAQWPTIPDILKTLEKSGLEHFMQIIDDVIFIVPDKPKLKDHLVTYAQKRANAFWEEFLVQQQKQVRPENSLAKFINNIKLWRN